MLIFWHAICQMVWKQKGLTQQAFAASVGITQGRVSQLLKGDFRPCSSPSG